MRDLIPRLLLVLGIPLALDAQVSRLTIGEGGLDWRESSQDLLGLDDSVSVGSLQPVEIDPRVNFAVGPPTDEDQSTTILGHIWSTSFTVPRSVEDKRPWVYGSPGHILVIDGDVTRPTYVSSVEDYSFDLGLPVPLNRVVFFPPERGRTNTSGASGLLRDLYPRQYVVSGSLNPREFLFTSTRADFDQVLGSSFSHNERVADVRFPTRFLRFARVRFPAAGFIAEVEFYGEGFLPETRYTSRLFDMGEPVNFGRLFYDFEVYRSPGPGLAPVPVLDAPVRIEVEVRSGRDDTPLAYHLVMEIGEEKVVGAEEFSRAPANALVDQRFEAVLSEGRIPGQQGSILDDVANWSFWSVPHRSSGEQIQIPDARRFVQLRAFITSQEVFAFGRLNSLSIEYSPLLADPVVGEVALVGDPNPADGVVLVPLGQPVPLTYDVRAGFASDTQTGFDAIRLQTPEAVAFQRLEMGDPLVVVEPDSLTVGERELVIYFPSHPVTPLANAPLRLTFVTRVFNFSTVFEGEVFQVDGDNLAQSIDGGDATQSVSTDGLEVIAPLERLQVLAGVDLGGRVLTPNGDGVGDGLTV
ncbi:MAG: hypothetical protein OSB03_16545, partial [Vicinamibacterales bacterium]|nr:hypothetical protein [Vicinamibacterales bacterium]